jgi:hypothetical protein
VLLSTRWPHLLAAAVVISGLVGAGRAAVQMYRVQRLVEAMTRESLEQATQLAPGDSNAWARLGALLDQKEEDPEAAGRALERAVAANPYNVPALLDLALHYEFQGETGRARQQLEVAGRLSRTYATRWARANFHLRQGELDEFWTHIREAIRLSNEDLTAPFELCWRATADPEEVLARAIPDEVSVYRHYFVFLTQRGQMAAAAGVWRRLEDRLDHTDLETGLRYADVLLSNRQVEPARAVWNRLCTGKLLPCAPLDPALGQVLTNGGFAHVPTSLAFDWRPQRHDGIDAEAVAYGADPALLVRFNGAHPESAELVWQWVPVEPRSSYRLHSLYMTEGLPVDTGLRWIIRDETSGTPLELAAGNAIPANEDGWGAAGVTFQAGPATRLIRLGLEYKRSPGTTRADGTVVVREVSLVPVGRAAAGLSRLSENRP